MKNFTMYVEVKINGVWEFEQRCYIEGNNTLFALLADVENDSGEVIPISFPKGFPGDCSEYIKEKYSSDNIYSFLTIDEILKYKVPEHDDFDFFMDIVDSYEFILITIAGHFEDVRFVFWFDKEEV